MSGFGPSGYEHSFLEKFQFILSRETRKAFESIAENDKWLDILENTLWAGFKKTIDQTTGMDSKNGFTFILRYALIHQCARFALLHVYLRGFMHCSFFYALQII